jgi:hypothetical protein
MGRVIEPRKESVEADAGAEFRRAARGRAPHDVAPNVAPNAALHAVAPRWHHWRGSTRCASGARPRAARVARDAHAALARKYAPRPGKLFGASSSVDGSTHRASQANFASAWKMASPATTPLFVCPKGKRAVDRMPWNANPDPSVSTPGWLTALDAALPERRGTRRYLAAACRDRLRQTAPARWSRCAVAMARRTTTAAFAKLPVYPWPTGTHVTSDPSPARC